LSAKTERIKNEIEKTKAKISELQARLRELDKQKTELENAEIVDAVRGMDISLADLAAMLKKDHAAKSGAATSGSPTPQGGLVAPKSEIPKIENEQEETNNA